LLFECFLFCAMSAMASPIEQAREKTLIAIEIVKQSREDLKCLQSQIQESIACKMDLLNERLQQLEMLKASSEIVPKRPKESKKDCRVFVGSRTRRPQVSHTTQGPTKLKDNMNQESDAQLHVETQKQLEHHLCENACLPQAKAICVKEGASAENDVQITVAFNAQCKPNMDEARENSTLNEFDDFQHVNRESSVLTGCTGTSNLREPQEPRTRTRPSVKKLSRLRLATGFPQQRHLQGQAKTARVMVVPAVPAQSKVETGIMQREAVFFKSPTFHDDIVQFHSISLPDLPSIQWESHAKGSHKHEVPSVIIADVASNNSSDVDDDEIEALEKTRQLLEVSLPAQSCQPDERCRALSDLDTQCV